MRTKPYGTGAAFALAYSKHRAFTLAELLMAILVISIIMVALAPVITRRAYDTVSIETNRKKGEEIWTNPGTYTFQVPVGISILEISGSAGGGGGAGAVSKNYSRTYNAAGTRTITVPKGVSQITFTLIGAGGGGGGANANKKSDTCKYPLTITAAADNGKDLCVSNFDPPIVGENWTTVIEVGTNTVRNNACWKATVDKNTANYCSETSWPSASPYFKGGGCKKMICTHEGAAAFCSNITSWSAFVEAAGKNECTYSGCTNRVSYRLFTTNEIKRLWAQSNYSNNYKWMFGQGLDLGMHMYTRGTLTNNRYTAANEYSTACTSPVSNACAAYALHTTDGNVAMLDAYNGDNSTPNFDRNGPSFGGITSTGQVRCVRELNNWDQYSGAGGATGARLTKTINVQPGDALVITTGSGGNGGNKGGGAGSQGGSTCLEHKRNNVRFVDPTNTLNNGYYCAYGGYGGKGATTSANGVPNSTLAGCTHNDGCTKSINGEAGGGSKGGRGANGADGATADLGQGGTAGLGYDSTTYYGGGGGGYCPRGNRTPSNCQKGGKGGIGGFTLTYDQYAPGGGGGSGGSAGLDELDNYKPVKLKVEGGETITFTIGAGGLGGQFSTSGQDGQDTIIARKGNNNVFTFYAGKKGETGSFSGSCAYDNQACAKGGLGGLGGRYPNPDLSPNSFSLIGPNSIQNGTAGALDTKGFYGGHGGATILLKTGSCAGYEINSDNTCSKYDANGNDGIKHNPITNRGGGAGGGGAGTDGKEGGIGGSGGNGFIRIKWDEASEE